MSNLNENLKKTIDDLDLDRRVQELSKLAQKTVADLKSQAANLARDNRDKVDEWVAKAGAAVDQRTDGKYHDKVQKFGVAVGNAVDKVAQRADGTPGRPSDGWTPSGPTGKAQPFPTHPYGAAESPATAGPQDVPTGWPHADGPEQPATADGESAGGDERRDDGRPWYAQS